MRPCIKISPSILSANFTALGDELKKLEEAGADSIHWDIMDGSFTEEITFGAGVVKACRRVTRLRFDVHLMTDFPEKQIPKFVEAGADLITVHAESTQHLHAALTAIKREKKLAGVAYNPGTSTSNLVYISDLLDSVTIMTVNPGKSGQKFLYSQIQKISEVREIVGNDIEICIDGGINFETIKEAVGAGASMFVSGSFLFKNEDYKDCIEQLKKRATI